MPTETRLSAAQCHICLHGRTEGELISPCKCKGTGKYVHSLCLSRWRQQAAMCGNKKDYLRCSVCLSEYELPVPNIRAKIHEDEVNSRYRSFLLILFFGITITESALTLFLYLIMEYDIRQSLSLAFFIMAAVFGFVVVIIIAAMSVSEYTKEMMDIRDKRFTELPFWNIRQHIYA